jgi:glycosyltransferase involved in cell wall biosynthesis
MPEASRDESSAFEINGDPLAENRTLRVIHTIQGLGESLGGPSRSVTGLCSAIRGGGVAVDIVAGVDRKLDDRLVLPATGVELHLVDLRRLARITTYPSFSDSINRVLDSRSGPGLVHDHGLWGYTNRSAWRVAKSRNIPYVLSPRGMLEPWALQYKRFKKKLGWWTYQRRIVSSAAVIAATADSEYESVRGLGLRNPVAVIPNGIDLDVPNSLLVSASGGEADGVRTALFLSRIQAKKGLLNLLHAWALISPVGWRLKIAGPDEGDHLREVLSTIERLGLVSSVEYVGAVTGEPKSRLYASADVFVLPTFSENFGLVIAEALAHGVPVITTKGTPWHDLEIYRCGWWIDIGVEPLVAALRKALALPDDERRAMGARGLEYVRRYNWSDIAQEMIGVYRWILGQGDRPACVRLD